MTTPREHADFAARQSLTDELRLTAKLAASYLTEAADTIENLREQLAEAQREAVSLARSLFKRHYAQEPHYASGEIEWEPFNDPASVISQIDNMVAGMSAQLATVTAERDALRAQLAEARAALKTVMRNAELSKEPCGSDPESPAAIRNGKFAGLASIAAQGLGMVRGPSLTEHLVEAQKDAKPAAHQGDNIAVRVCRSVAELPDRDSPEGWPEAMLVTHEELHAIVLGALNDDQPTTAATPDEATEYAYENVLNTAKGAIKGTRKPS